jgi:hypothetical protein
MISRRQFAPASKRQLRMIPSIASVQERGISRWGIPFTFRALRVTAPVGCALKRNLLIYAPRDRTPTSGCDILVWQKNTQRGKDSSVAL